MVTVFHWPKDDDVNFGICGTLALGVKTTSHTQIIHATTIISELVNCAECSDYINDN